ncbi:DUF3656 domain-containing protein [Isosphaeraceae bacterium EP7]
MTLATADVASTETATEVRPGRGRLKPELLAPAGDRACMVAAVENGADAVYFGLKGHNARARAVNFDDADLTEVMAFLHRRGVRGYVALNTLAFPSELEALETSIRQVAAAGVDAVIVQDLGVARMIRAICPDLDIHASTQMSVTSAEGVALARELGCTRVILARELSLDEIGQIRRTADLPVEVFVHGALCVAYSGQCLTSEALGGRSANRGECAQACRMPYEVVCDGETRDLGPIQYLLSPQDLAAYDLIPQLIELGVASLKIEGRLKAPEYVANISRHYRRAIDAAWAGEPVEFQPREVQEMELSFSRGFSHGFFDGNDHKLIVRGDHAKKRGIFVGKVASVRGDRVRIDLAAPVKNGDGLVFDGDADANVPEQGGRIYGVTRPPIRGQKPTDAGELCAGPADLAFGARDLDLARLSVGQRVWKTDDPELTRRIRKTYEGPPHRLMPVDLRVEATVGQPLKLEARTESGVVARVESDAPLEAADRHPATEEMLAEQLGRMGGTTYELREMDVRLEGQPMVPKSLLNGLRRDLIVRLDAEAGRAPERAIAERSVLGQLRPSMPEVKAGARVPADLYALCRTHIQVEASIAAGVEGLYLDFQEIKGYQPSIAAAKQAGVPVYLATPRIEKPGEAPIFRYLAKQGADGLLVRNAGGMAFCVENEIPYVADFSLNASNELTVAYLMGRGTQRVTASYDLSVEQLVDLLRVTPPDWLEVVIHQQIPMFHMEFCAFCAFLSPGTDKTNCGRPCDDHEVKLRDRTGVEHPLKADVGCRNTLFNAVPQTAAEFLPKLLSLGVRRVRVEFVDDDAAGVGRILGLYRGALTGQRDARTLWRALKASNQYGVTRGQLAVIQ